MASHKDLFPLIHEYLLDAKLTKTLSAFKKESKLVRNARRACAHASGRRPPRTVVQMSIF